MRTALIVLASLAGFLLLLVIAAKVLVWVVKRRILRAVGDLGGAIESLGQLVDGLKAGMPPARIHLQPLAGPGPEDEPVESLLRPLRGAGFEAAGWFDVPETPGLRLAALLHPQEDVCAVAYRMPSLGAWLDLVTLYEDETSITYTNTARGSGLDRRPGHPIVRRDGAAPLDLFHRMVRERSQRPRRKIAPQQFPGIYEQFYAESMDWRAQHGFSDEEIRAQAVRDRGQAPDQTTLAMTRALLQTQAQQQLEEALLEHYRAQSGLGDEPWAQLEGRLVFIHDKMNPAEVEGLLDIVMGEDDDPLWQQADRSSPRALFASVNARLPEDSRFQKLGEVQQPLPADVYRSPDVEEEPI